MPMARFHRIMMITSIIDAVDPIEIVRKKTCLNFQVLKHPWYSSTPQKLTTELMTPETVM